MEAGRQEDNASSCRAVELRIKQVTKLVFPAGALVVEVSCNRHPICHTCETPVVNGHAEVEAWTRFPLRPDAQSFEFSVSRNPLPEHGISMKEGQELWEGNKSGCVKKMGSLASAQS
jgi:hypothetical protein